MSRLVGGRMQAQHTVIAEVNTKKKQKLEEEQYNNRRNCGNKTRQKQSRSE